MTAAPSYRITAHATIDAPAARVYGIIADYRTGHPRIVPREFSDLTVEEGGVGAGTVIRFCFTTMGQTHAFRAVVTEPEPGRVLVEENVPPSPSPSGTVFTVEPVNDGRTHVTIDTTLTTRRRGIAGRIEGFLSQRILRSVYERELRLLRDVAR
jgi:hypothetical protein